MKAIILAAGKGTRLAPITNTRPKPLIEIMGKTILEYNLETIYDKVDEIIIIVKYLKEQITNKFGSSYKKTKITYVEQGKDDGTGAALKYVNYKNKDDVLILNGDTIFNPKDINKLIGNKKYGCLVKQMANPSIYGIFIQDLNGYGIGLIEKPKENIGNLANLGCYKVSKDFFLDLKKLELSQRGEYEIIEPLLSFMKNNEFELLEAKGEFIDIGYPWDILNANINFCSKIEKSKIKGIIEDGVIIKGNIVLEKGALIMSGAYIEGNAYIGKNTIIGPRAYLRGNVIIGENCVLGGEIKDSVIGNNTKCKHFSYIGYSVLGDNVNIGCGFVTADLRHDKKNIRMMVKGELINTGRYKMGVIIGDNAMTGIHTSVYPGRIIENDGTTLPGEVVK